MSHIDNIKKYFEEQYAKMKSSIEKEKAIRDTSLSAMESHHDTTRNQTEKLIQALEVGLKELEKNIKQIPTSGANKKNQVGLWSRVEMKIGDNNLRVVLVPQGLGGQKINDFQTLAENTPLGQAIINKSKSSEFEMNGNTGKIIEVLQP